MNMLLSALAAAKIADWWTDALKVLGVIGMKALSCVIVIAVCVLIAYALRFVIRRIVRRIVAGAKSKANVDDTQALERSPLADMRLVQRTRTLGSILQNIVNVALVIIAIILVVNTVDSSLLGSLTLLTAAVGAGLGFGAQNIVKDVLNGIFLVAEDQIGIGDVVELKLGAGAATGVVEYVSVRVTQVRDVNGTLWYVRNGEITHLGNMSQGWARAIVDLGVPVDADLARRRAGHARDRAEPSPRTRSGARASSRSRSCGVSSRSPERRSSSGSSSRPAPTRWTMSRRSCAPACGAPCSGWISLCRAWSRSR